MRRALTKMETEGRLQLLLKRFVNQRSVCRHLCSGGLCALSRRVTVPSSFFLTPSLWSWDHFVPSFSWEVFRKSAVARLQCFALPATTFNNINLLACQLFVSNNNNTCSKINLKFRSKDEWVSNCVKVELVTSGSYFLRCGRKTNVIASPGAFLAKCCKTLLLVLPCRFVNRM
jgi:hypothetical protein